MDYFAPNYRAARQRFREAARRLGADIAEYPLAARGAEGEPLTIDVARLSGRDPGRAVVVSSGLHGVEGFFGSAVQGAWMTAAATRRTLPPASSVVLIHALNPFGFSHRRRTDEQNIDLNRNYLLPGQEYGGSPALYGRIDGLLNPPREPGGRWAFRWRVAGRVCRHGLAAFTEAVAGGQYDFPRGLFYGGSGPAASTLIVRRELAGWLGSARDVMHLDLHTGLGRSGRYKLLLFAAPDSPQAAWCRARFGREAIEPSGGGRGVASYASRGVMGPSLAAVLPDDDYRFVVAEFGTYGSLRVLAALRDENCAHHFGQPGSASYERAKRELVECFCPGDARWRRRAVDQGVRLIEQALADPPDATRSTDNP